MTKDDDDAASQAAWKAWHGGFKGYAEKSDPWLALAFRDRDLIGDAKLQSRFRELASVVHVPLCRALHGGYAP